MRTFVVCFLLGALPAQDPPRVLDSLARAAAAREAGRLEEALAVLEQALKGAPEEVSLWEEKGAVACLLARKNQAEGRAGGFFEAALALEQALALGAERCTTHLYLASVYRETGRALEALRMASRALDLAEGQAEEGEARFEAGCAANGLLRKGQGNEEQRAGWLQAALENLAEAARLQPGNPQAWIYLSNSHAWAGGIREELKALRKGLWRCPRSEALHAYTQDRLFALGLYEEAAGILRGLIAEAPENSAALWYLGRARLALAEELRRDEEPERALQAYQEALPLWKEAARREPSFGPASARAAAMALVGEASLRIDRKEPERAEALLVQAFEHWPEVYGEADAFGATYATAMSRIGAALLAEEDGAAGAEDRIPAARAAALRRAAQFFERLIARHPDRSEELGYWCNNLGLALRDLGCALAGSAGGPAAAEARECWQNSYKAYLKAVELQPDDPRILNDAALLQVHHLGTDLDRAEELLLRAKEIGLERIEAEQDGWSRERMEFLEEAVGDAWANLGLLYTRHRGDREKGRACAAEAQNYFPRRQNREREPEAGK